MPVPPSTAPAIGVKDFVTWTLTTVSLAWNFWNFRRTNRVSKELRQDAFDHDDWKWHRGTITSRLDEFDAAGDRLLVLAKGQHKAADLRIELEKEIQGLSIAHEALLRALRVYGSTEWENLGYGGEEKTTGESDWDRLNSILAEVTQMGSDADGMRDRLSTIRIHKGAISGGISGRIVNQSEQHRPL